MKQKTIGFVLFMLTLGLFLAACLPNGSVENAEEEKPIGDGESNGEVEDPQPTEEVEPTEVPIPPALNCEYHSRFTKPVRIPAGELSEDAEGLRIFWTIYANEHGIISIEEILLERDIGSVNDLYEIRDSIEEDYSLNLEHLFQELINELVWKEISIWEIEGGSAKEIYCDQFELEVSYVCPETKSIDDRLSWLKMVAQERAIVLAEGCYLSVLDEGLSAQAATMGVDVPLRLDATESVVGTDTITDTTTLLDQIAEGDNIDHTQFLNGFYVGENIRLDVFFEPVSSGIHPLFHYPQYYSTSTLSENHTAVIASEIINTNSTRAAVWQVRAESDSGPPIYDVSNPYELSGYHYLMTRQDLAITLDDIDGRDFDSRLDCPEPTDGDPTAYFEFQLEENPIRQDACDLTGHYFSTGEVLFSIGDSPDLSSNLERDTWAMDNLNANFGEGAYSLLEEDDTLRGSIKELMFDPNSSCYGCS